MTELTYNRLAPALNGKDGLIRTHWAKRKKIKDTWIKLTKAQEYKQYQGQVIVEYERHSVSPMDWDNLCASFKIPGDVLVACGIIEDDNPTVVTQFIPRWVKSKNNKHNKTVIRVYPI